MTSRNREFLDYLLELLDGLPALRTRAMFGGYGIYSEDRMFGLVADDELFLKTDDSNRDEFIAAGCTPFIYRKQGQDMPMSYYSVPADALDDADTMLYWARLAVAAALRKPLKKKVPGKPPHKSR